MTATRTKRSNQKSEQRKAEVELAVQGIDDDEPDFREFLRRW
jgi:hypothetical protein